MLGLIKRHPVAATGFVLALGFTVFFGFQTISKAIYWADPDHHNQPPEAWMTPRYIAMSWQMDPRELAEELGMPKDPRKRPTLKWIAKHRDVPVEQVIKEATAIVQENGTRR
jgi:hypothetical protein